MLVAILFHKREQFAGDTVFQLPVNPPAYYLGDTIERVREVSMIEIVRQDMGEDPGTEDELYESLIEMGYGTSNEEIDELFSETGAWIIHKEDYDKITVSDVDLGSDTAVYRHISTLKQIVHNFSIGVLLGTNA